MSAKSFFDIFKYNDNHDPKTGRFAPKNSGGTATGGSFFRGDASKFTQEQKDKYIELLNTDEKEAAKYRSEMKMSIGDSIAIKREAEASGKLKPKEKPAVVEKPKVEKPKEEKPADDYRMSHRPSAVGRGFDITEADVIPKDVYDHPEWYFNMRDKATKESMNAVKQMRNKPEAEVTIYRASPKDEFNDGDWITLSPTYAKTHAESNSKGDLKLEVYSRKVKAKEIQFAGDDINEFGYFPNIANEKPVFKGISPLFSVIFKFNPYHDERGRFTSGGGAGAPAVATKWAQKMEQEKADILSQKTSEQALFLYESGMLDYDEAVAAMKSKTTEAHINNYFAVMSANGNPTSEKPLADNKTTRNQDVDSGKYSNHDEAKKAFIKEKAGMSDEEAVKTSKEFETWTSNSWGKADTSTLDNYIEKDHTYDGEIFRGMSFSNEDYASFMANIEVGSTISMKRNSSWSSSEADARQFSHVSDDNANSVMIRCVKNRTASPIAYLNSQGENEVIAHSKSKWSVLNVQTTERGTGAKKTWLTVIEKGAYDEL